MPLFNKDTKKLAVEAKEKGNKLFAQKKFKDAIECYNKAIKYDPSDAAFYSNRAAAYMGLADYENALQDSNECIKIKSDWSKGHFRKGCALVSLKRYLDAEAALLEGLKKEPGNADIKKKLEEIEPEISKLRPKLNPDGTKMTASQAIKEEGNKHFKDARYDLAIDCYTRALTEAETTDEKAVLFTNRATCHAQLHQFSEVVKDCTSALKQNPKSAKALLRRGLAYEALEKWDLGIEDMKEVLTLEPGTLQASQTLQRLSKNKEADAKWR